MTCHKEWLALTGLIPRHPVDENQHRMLKQYKHKHKLKQTQTKLYSTYLQIPFIVRDEAPPEKFFSIHFFNILHMVFILDRQEVMIPVIFKNILQIITTEF